MPAVNTSSSDKAGDFRVLVTGYGEFGPFKENPSWIAVRTLHNLILETSSDKTSATDAGTSAPRRIHITSLHVPVTYKDVLEIVPGLHARPPALPSSVTDVRTPPSDGYDFILHVGVAPPDLMRLESRGHKLGYNKRDNDDELAPIVEDALTSGFDRTKGPSEAEKAEGERLKNRGKDSSSDRVVRGFGTGYEKFDDELISDLDASELVDALKAGGYKDIRLSNDAGRYLCDFIYYCSLAEQRRAIAAKKGKNSRVLFLHCPPIDDPLSTEQVVDCIKRLVILVCKEIEKGK